MSEYVVLDDSNNDLLYSPHAIALDDRIVVYLNSDNQPVEKKDGVRMKVFLLDGSDPYYTEIDTQNTDA